jgi:predicted ATPase/transcriptional regulator with XRE-family HTH domain
MVKKASDAKPNLLLRMARKESGWTQQQVADRIGASQSLNVSRWESGTAFPSAYYIQQLCQLFGKSARELGLIRDETVLKSDSHLTQVPLDSSHAIQPLWTVPTLFTSLVGRKQDVADVCELLRHSEVRLLTLVGTGGVGKTRLALQVATEIRTAFADGVCFVPLASVSDPSLVIPTIAEVLDIKQTGERSLFERVKLSLRDRRILLILDNFEQVVETAPQVEELLATCPAMTVIVTSRTILHLQAEQVYTVFPLALPPPGQLLERETLAQFGAVSLFLQRARSTLPSLYLSATNLNAIVEICRHLDGLPLAIELAAARVRLLPPLALLSHLKRGLQVLSDGARTLPERQQTLHNTLKWSYELLSSEEQCLFRRLSAFSGGWTLDAAEAVWRVGQQTEGNHLSVLEGVAALLDKSLLLQVEQEGEEPRLQMLVTVRVYGQECLQASGEDELIRYAHAQYYLAVAEEAESHLKGAEKSAWLARMEREQENLRAALEWCITRENAELALHICGALWEFWSRHGNRSEERYWLKAALGLPGAGTHQVARAKALYAAGYLAWDHNDLSEANLLLRESVALYRALGDDQGLARSLGTLGVLIQQRGHLDEGRTLVEESIALHHKLGSNWELANLLQNLSYVAWWQGDLTRVAALAEESLILARGVGDKFLIAMALHIIGNVAWRQSDLVRASILVQESLVIFRELGDKSGIVGSLETKGSIALAQHDLEQASACFQEGFALARQLGDYIGWYPVGLARVAAAKGHLNRAVGLFALAETVYGITRIMNPDESTAFERELAAMRSQLGEEVFAAAWAEGVSLTAEQVVAAP